MNKENLLICVELEEYSFAAFRNNLINWNWSEAKEISFVHVFERKMFFEEFHIESYPSFTQWPEIEKSILEMMNNLAKDVVKDPAQLAKVRCFCILSDDTKKEMEAFIEDKKIDLAFVANRGIHGLKSLLSNSFTEYLIRHTPCHIFVLRNI